jgi:pyruvate dehydrogenase E2 component (dihydrolipoamide acetyltransferase)
MSIEVRLPQYGMAMQEGTIVRWFKKEGDSVEAGEILAEVEAEKATEELLAAESGVLDQILVPEGTTVAVNEVLALLAAPGGAATAAASPVKVSTSARMQTATPPPETAAGEVEPLGGMRATIAHRMHSSLQSMAQLTLVTTADVTELVAYRRGLVDEPRPTYTDLVVKAAAAAIRQHPTINSTLEANGVRMLADIHIGIATDVPGGLVVPVLRHADRKSLPEIAAESASLTRRARAGDIRIDEVTGSTFTVTSLGGQGIDAFTPIVNPPEVAILGVGRITEQPARDGDGGLVWRQVMTMSLTIDHRVIDGVPGAAFLAAVGARLGNPRALQT